MIPLFNFRPFLIQYEESSEDEDSNSSIDATSVDDLAVPVPSTSSAKAVDLTSRMPSTSVLVRIFPKPSTSSMPQMVPVQMTPVDPVSTMDPMSSIPSTSRRIQHHSHDFRFEAARPLNFQNSPATGQIHEICTPDYIFLRNEHCGNVAIGADAARVLRRKRRNRNISCPYRLQYTKSLASDRLLTKLIRNPTAEKLEYASYVSRLNTFAKWPTDMTQTSEQLADAGFYYTGRNDITTCHHCGISIGNWSPGEDPWQRHAISSPRCCYLLTVRGWEYVNNVTGQEYYESSAEAPTLDTVGSDERPNSENEIDEVTLAEKIAALEEENQALRDARSCKVCTEREATITCLSCGHLATCHFCAPAFDQCIICRREVKAVTRIFLA